MKIDFYLIRTDRQDVSDAVSKPDRFSKYRRDRIRSLKSFPSKCLSAAAGIATDEGLRHFGLNEKDAGYVLNKYGKPYVAGHPEIIFNVSHSGEYAVAAFLEAEEAVPGETVRSEAGGSEEDASKACEREKSSECVDLGVDIEQVARMNRRILPFMKNDVGFEDTDEELCRRWTVREAFIKCIGTGLSSIREDYHIEKTATGNLRLCQDIYDGEFTIIEPEAPDGYRIACVIWEHPGTQSPFEEKVTVHLP